MIFLAKNKKIPPYTPLTVNGVIIHRSHQEKYLGLQLDDKLIWKAHIEHVRSKISSTTGALRRAVGCIPRKVQITIYNTLVKPHLEYLIEIWGCAAKTNLKNLQISQNKLIKTIFNYHYQTNTRIIYKETKIFNLNQLYTYTTCVLVKKIISEKIHTKITFTKRSYKYSLRNTNKIKVNTPRTNYGKRNILFEGAQLFNKLPNDVKNCKNIHMFKTKLKKYIYEHVF